MNKKILLLLSLAVFMTAVVLMSPVNATTTLDVDWDADDGTFNIDMNTTDTYMYLSTGGDHIEGSLYGIDFDNDWNGVDSFMTNVSAYVEDGGIIYGVDRVVGYYGSSADESTLSLVSSSGNASLTFQTATNFLYLQSHSGWTPMNQFTASGDYFVIHGVQNGDNMAWFEAEGDGTLDILHRSETAYGTGIEFGRGGGCYTVAVVTLTGEGCFEVGAFFENSMSGDFSTTAYNSVPTWTAYGNVTYLESISFDDGFSWTDYSFRGN